MAGVSQTLKVIAGAEQGVDVESGHALEPQHDGVGTQETLKPPLVLAVGCALQCVSQCNINFIGFGFTAVGPAAMRCDPRNCSIVASSSSTSACSSKPSTGRNPIPS
ncbi:MAG: hypothetical protein CM15mP74_29970 [Halieaceae bacterium]|nr:MAG: hypothetical protein CM15mP74_29970 [Halieaceae bacterium]